MLGDVDLGLRLGDLGTRSANARQRQGEKWEFDALVLYSRQTDEKRAQ